LREWLAVRPESDTDRVWIAVEHGRNPLSERSVQRILTRYRSGWFGTFLPTYLPPYFCKESD